MPSETIERLSLILHLRRLLLLALSSALASGATTERKAFTMEGLLRPAPRFSFVYISSVAPGFNGNAPIYWDGKFKFRNLATGSYVVAVYVPRMGEFRQTFSVGPSTADEKGRVKITVFINPSRAEKFFSPKEGFTV